MKNVRHSFFVHKMPTCTLTSSTHISVSSFLAFFHHWWNTMPPMTWHNEHLISSVRNELSRRGSTR